MSRQIAVWDPFRMMDGDFFGRPMRALLNNISDEMAVDVSETENEVIVKISAAGFSKDNIDIHIEDMALTVTGRVENKTEEENKEQKYYRKGINTQSFSQTVSLPTKVESDQAKASFRDGILSITLPKATEVKPKKIEISVE